MTTISADQLEGSRSVAPNIGRIRQALSEARQPSGWAFMDGARGIAIIAVVAFHLLRLVGNWHSAKVHRVGVPVFLWPFGVFRFAIDVFFVLSGFLIAFTWWRHRERIGRTLPALREYGRRRALRILPVFWVMAAIVIPWRAPEILTDPKRLFLVATVQQYVLPHLPNQFNVVTWSLTTETQFYLLAPLLALLVQRRFGGLATLAATVSMTVWWFYARGTLPSSLLMGRLDQFVVGMVVADLYLRHREGARPLAIRVVSVRGMGWIMGAGFVAVGVFHGTTLGLPHGSWFDPWQHPVAGVLVAGLGLRLLCQPRTGLLKRILEHPLLLVAGAMSYSIYLWHLPVLRAVFQVFGPIGQGVPVVGSALRVALGLLLALALSVLSYTYVERPFLHRKSRRRRPAPRPATATATPPRTAAAS